jgi:rhodanese-related sulfurtransferase
MSAGNEPIEIDCDSVRSLLMGGGDIVLLDCRESSEWDTARIEGASLLPMSELAERVGELNGKQGDNVVVHCHHGGRSLRVAMWLRQQGFSRAKSMAGGIDKWSLEIDPSVPRY